MEEPKNSKTIATIPGSESIAVPDVKAIYYGIIA